MPSWVLPDWGARDMVWSSLLGIVVLVGVMLVWVVVQSAWRNVFLRSAADPDVLARRLDCGNCGCTDSCERGSPTGNTVGEERIHE